MTTRTAHTPLRVRRHYAQENVHTKTFTPTEYQVELLDAAKQRNIVACLGSGIGKTFLAVMAIKELAHELREVHDVNGKKTVFLVPTVALVHQQAKVIEEFTDLKVGKYYIDMKVELWDKDTWMKELQANHVLVMTVDVLLHALTRDFIVLSQLNLLIFDECHSALKLHPYREIMRAFDLCDQELRPRILGLSASLVNSKCRPCRLGTEIRNLEKTMRSSVETASDLAALTKCGSKPKESLVLYLHYSSASEHYQRLIRVLNRTYTFLDDMPYFALSVDKDLPDPCSNPKKYLLETFYILNHLGPWCAYHAAELFLKEVCRLMDQLMGHPMHRYLLMLAHTALHTTSLLCQHLMSGMSEKECLVDLAPNKLQCMLQTLVKFKPESVASPVEGGTESSKEVTVNGDAEGNPQTPSELSTTVNTEVKEPTADKFVPKHTYTSQLDAMYQDDPNALCGIIFVSRRITAYILYRWLLEVAKHAPNFAFLMPCYMIGQANRRSGGSSKDSALGLRRPEEVMQKFRSREYNLLVATSVVEEGLDIPRCNLVIRFDLPHDFRTYIQSKGRARAPGSEYVLMVQQEEKMNFFESLSDFRTIEEILLRHCHGRDEPSEDEINEHMADQEKEPYVPVKDGTAQVTMSTAIALVNRYCAKLPSDAFTKLTPWWKVKTLRQGNGLNPLFQCTIELPINSPLKEPIAGDPMKSKHLAKMATALLTCQKLHEIGELDDNLQPVGKEAVKYEEEMQPEWYEEIAQGTARPGTTKRRQYYYKQVADALHDTTPKTGQPSHLYMFHMKLTCPILDEQNTRGRKIYDPADTLQGLGILTAKKIPLVCSFPVFTRSGEVTVSLLPIGNDLALSEEQLEQLNYFHKYLFANVLRLEKYPMVFKPQDAQNGLIVPINQGEQGAFEIDWNFVSVISKERVFVPHKLTEDERKDFVFDEEQYTDAVIVPWYRNLDKPQFFYVAKICADLNPQSEFPDTGFQTFEGYYQTKYEIKILNTQQPLLDVDHTSARLNLLTPRYVNRKGITLPTSSEQTKKAKRENLQQKQILIPELCVIHPFPASLWRKTVCLPCILYRINSLLLAEQLRVVVAEEINVGAPELPVTFEWPKLDFGWTLAEVLQKAQEAALKEEQKGNATDKFLPGNPQTNNLSNDISSFPISTWSNEMAADINMQKFDIGIFDPSKDKNSNKDFDLDEEVANINFGNMTMLGPPPDASTASSWAPVKPDVEAPVRIRYGSPSVFEEAGWDTEWDADDAGLGFSLNIPGIGYISAPGMFNMEGLSLDLASCRDDDIWDSFDEESIPDESEMDFSMTVQESQQPNNSETKEVSETSPLPPEPSQGSLDTCESEWLSTHMSRDDAELLALEECEIEDSTDPFVEEHVNWIRELKKSEIFSEADHREYSNPCKDAEEIMLALTSHMATDGGCDDTTLHQQGESNNVWTTDQSGKAVWHKIEPNVNGDVSEETIPFGDLLPDREKLHCDEKDIFRVHFDEQPNLETHPGPSPSIILQAYTMSNANDGINLERLETVGDSFLKYAITAYLYCTYQDIHEGKLSYLRSKQISNLNLYRLGKRKGLGGFMVATKFEPNDNWLPPCYTVPKGLEQALIESGTPASHWNIGHLQDLTLMSEDQIRQSVMEKKKASQEANKEPVMTVSDMANFAPYIPYNLLTQHSIPDKSIADCVEALIGAYLISCGPKGALLFMSWLGLKVLRSLSKAKTQGSATEKSQPAYKMLEPPKSPLLTHVPDYKEKMNTLLSGYQEFEQKLSYSFNDRAYLLQAFTHASYSYNRLTDCYQRLEFLGDAVLDYLITRHLYEDPQKHSPGTLTDLRSALVNNTFFASLAVKYDFHKYFKTVSPGLFAVINKFVDMKKKSSGFEDYAEYYLEEEECEEAEEVEVPKALGDIFESVAGAIYLDSGMSLDIVWKVYYAMMKPEIEYFSTHVPKSPIRELLEMEPQTAKFERAELTMSGKVRVRVEVFGKGSFVGVGRNKRIAKCTAAKRALRALKKMKREKAGSF